MPVMAKETEKFIVYKSSAGSGKTFTLVREYLKIVLQNPDQFRHILAITFTNKAANEMKERIVRNLVILSEPDAHRDEDTIRYLLPQLSAHLELTEDRIRERASLVLRLIMHHYAEFAISTIDSFTHRVIRTFAHDLKIPMNFEVELDADAMLSQSVDLLISQVGNNDLLTRVMVDFVEKKAGDELNWQIEKDLNEFGKALISESGIIPLMEIRNYDLEVFIKVRGSLAEWQSKWENSLRKLAGEVVDLIEQEHLPTDAFIQKDRGVVIYLQNLAHGKFEKIRPNSYARTALESGEWINPKSSGAQQEAFNRIAGRVMPAGRLILERIDNELPRYTLCRMLLNNLYSTALLSEIEKTLHALCLDDNKLLISEFNRRISDIVREQPAPFIYERLGERYHHYLIDEFQDTSILQWHNLLPLIENSLASDRLNLVVGDAKQAIYRWRSGDAEQFEQLPGLIMKRPDLLLEAREKALINHYREEKLDQNHRSSPVIVEFNNRFFSYVAGTMPEPYGKTFRHATQFAAKASKPGMVRIEKVARDEGEERSYEELVHEKIYSIIEELKEDRFPLQDLAILCRKNERASKIAAYLISRDIPVISSESLLLTQSEHVNFLVAWMRHLVDPTDVVSLAHILQYLTGKGMLKDKNLEDIFAKNVRTDANTVYEILREDFPFIQYQWLKNLDVFALAQYLAYYFNLNSFQDSYLRFFQDVILEFMKGHRGGLPEFLEWWEEKSLKASVIIPEGINAVRIMTVHKAKGLQFPVVIYPFADEQVRATRNNLWVSLDEDYARPLKTAYLPAQKSLAETIYRELYEDEMNRSQTDMVNVLYVALTRPEERLYVLTKDLPVQNEGVPSVPRLLGSFLSGEGALENDGKGCRFGERWQRPEKTGPRDMEEKDTGPYFCRPSLNMLLRRHAPEAWDIEDPEKN
ncbi:MAG: UvrD-helicase domain-containing protein, partial [Bacteroidales bacterium]|nr:UvrD-helicase domain-containing protein [Bacteroidales bacterium]